MKIPALLFVLFFFLTSLSPVKCAMRDTYDCFIKRGNCRHECHYFESHVGFCTKLNAKCCM
ncbi:beta-defensin 133 [Tupaia chinensis]|uniref:beta-defensin 133 n=1 Tax=Tupaia chinensis TaxID=246437 RepID=UPI000FFBCE2C|nr:beta-defensin 133 [Tupaia chinensis]